MEAGRGQHDGNGDGSRQNEASQIRCSGGYYGFIVVVANLDGMNFNSFLFLLCFSFFFLISFLFYETCVSIVIVFDFGTVVFWIYC